MTDITLTDAERRVCNEYHRGPTTAMCSAAASGMVHRSTAIDLLAEVAAAMDKVGYRRPVPGDASHYDYITLDLLRGRLLDVYGTPEPPESWHVDLDDL